MHDIRKILNDVGLSASEISVYIALLEGAVGAKEIMKVTGEKRPTVYYALQGLEQRGLVSKTGKEHGSLFQIESLERLKVLAEQKLQKQKEMLLGVETLVSTYASKQKAGQINVSYFDSVASIQSAIMYSVYVKKKEILTIVPEQNFFKDSGSDFIKKYVLEKKRRGVATKAIWEHMPTSSVVREYYTDDSEARSMPKALRGNFETTIFMYDDKVLYIGPKKDMYAILIQSESYHKSMRALFDLAWVQAQK